MVVSPFLLVGNRGQNVSLRHGNVLGVLDDLPKTGPMRQVGYGLYRLWVDWLKLDKDILVQKLSGTDLSFVDEWRLTDLDDLYRMYGYNASKFRDVLGLIYDVLKQTKDVPVVAEFYSETLASKVAKSIVDEVRFRL